MTSNPGLFGKNFVIRTSLKELKQGIEIALEYVWKVVPKRTVKDYLTDELAQDMYSKFLYFITDSFNLVVSTNPEIIEIMIKSAIKDTIQRYV